MDWKDSRAEAAMREGTEKIRLAAVEKAKAQEANEMKDVPNGKYMITFKANDKVEEGEVKAMLDIIQLFAEKCDENHPNVSILIQPMVLVNPNEDSE